MYPDPPFPGFSWVLPHHSSYLDPERDDLRKLLEGVVKYAGSTEFKDRINDYIIQNGIFTRNVREGRADPFRDYQQLLAQLGLIVSRSVIKQPIIITDLGLSFVNGDIDFYSLMTMQMLRFQYPNGHNVANGLARRHQLANVHVRPAVLIWQVLRSLGARSESVSLNVDEIQRFVMACSNHNDVESCASHIIHARSNEVSLSLVRRYAVGDRRNAQDRIKFLQVSPLFSGLDGITGAEIRLSDDAYRVVEDIDAICSELAATDSFWQPGDLGRDDRLSWYLWFGSIDLRIAINSAAVGSALNSGAEVDELPLLTSDDQKLTGRQRLLNLEPYHVSEAADASSKTKRPGGSTITAAYDAELVRGRTALHDVMVSAIARTAEPKVDEMYFDRGSVDLLLVKGRLELLVEVKTVTPRNLITRIRLAVGQILHYDYVRSLTSARERRKVIGLAASVPQDAWYLDFLNGYLDFDLLALDSGSIRSFSTNQTTIDIFSSQ